MALPAAGGTDTGTYWVVYYVQGQNQVSSRYVVTPAPGSGASPQGFIVLSAPTAQAARQQAQSRLGPGEIVSSVDGPYRGTAAAQAAGSGKVQASQRAMQAGHLPGIPNPLSGLAAIGDFFTRLTEPATWLRAGEVILGLLLIAVGVAKMTDAVPVASRVAKALS
jgi:hypothetical protein